MVAHQVQERFVANELSRAIDGVPVSSRPILWDKPYRACQASGGLCVPSLIAGPHHDTNLPNVRAEGLLDENAKDGFLGSIVD
jgi:hypothetical protein